MRVPLVHGLSRLGWQGVPGRERERLEIFRRSHVVRALSLAEELARIAKRFETAGIPFAAFKGATLAVSLYGDLAAREYNDNDILIPRDRLDDAEHELAQLGYRGRQGDRAFRRAFLRHLRQYAFVHPDVDAYVDLHWGFAGRHLPFPLAVDDVWPHLRNVRVVGTDVPTLAEPNLALLLAGHGTKEAWRCLMWVGDFATLVVRAPTIDWPDVYERARRQGCANAVLLGCAMASRLLDVSAPPALAGILAGSDRVRKLAGRMAAPLAAGVSERAETMADFDLCDRSWDKARAALRLLVTPTASDHDAWPMPRQMWGLYWLTRPLRLAGKALRRARPIGRRAN